MIMSNYIRFHAVSLDLPDHFYRDFLINDAASLKSFALLVTDLFGGNYDSYIRLSFANKKIVFRPSEMKYPAAGNKVLSKLSLHEGDRFIVTSDEGNEAYEFEVQVVGFETRKGNQYMYNLGGEGNYAFCGMHDFFLRFIKEQGVPEEEFPDCIDYLTYEEWLAGYHPKKPYQERYKIKGGKDEYFDDLSREIEEENLQMRFIDPEEAEDKMAEILTTYDDSEIASALASLCRQCPTDLPLVLEMIYWKRLGKEGLELLKNYEEILFGKPQKELLTKEFLKSKDGLHYVYTHVYSWITMMDMEDFKRVEKELNLFQSLGAPEEFIIPLMKKVYLMQGEFDKYRAYAKKHPHEYDVFNEAFILMKQGKYIEALAKADEGEEVSQVVADAIRYGNFDGFENRSPFMPRAYGDISLNQGASYFLTFGASVGNLTFENLAYVGSTRLIKECGLADLDIIRTLMILMPVASGEQVEISVEKIEELTEIAGGMDAETDHSAQEYFDLLKKNEFIIEEGKKYYPSRHLLSLFPGVVEYMRSMTSEENPKLRSRS